MRFDLIQYLYFLPLSLLPVVIYLIFRRKPRKLVFGSLFLLKNITKKVNRRTKLKDLILLVLRTLFLIFLVFLFARPFTGSDSGFDPSLDSIYAVYFDSSPSMADKFPGSATKLNVAKNFMINNISKADREDLFSIFTTDPDKKFRGRKDDAIKFISDINVYGRERKFFNVYAGLDSLMNEYKNKNKIFISVTDGLIKTVDHRPEKKDLESKVFILNNPESEINDISIESADLINRNELEVKLFSQGKGSARLDIFRDGKKISTHNVSFSSAPYQTVRIELSNAGNTESLLTLKTEDKQNSLNNILYLTIPALSKKNVLIAGDKKSIPVRALISLLGTQQDSLFIPDVVAADMINSVDFKDYDLIVFTDMSSINPFAVSNLKDFLNRSGSIYFIADEQLNLNDYNTSLTKELKLPQILGVEKSEEGSFSGISITDIDHPVFKDVFLTKSANPSTVEIYSYYKFSDEDWNVLMETSRYPLLLERNFLKGKIFLLSTGLDPENSNIIRNGVAVPALLNAFLYMTSTEITAKSSYLTGDRIEFDKHRYLTDASKKFDPSKSEFSKIFLLKDPGFYRINEENGVQTGTIAVNSEREITENETGLLTDLFDTKVIDNESQIEEINLLSSTKNDLSNILFIAIVLILISEIMIVRFM